MCADNNEMITMNRKVLLVSNITPSMAFNEAVLLDLEVFGPACVGTTHLSFVPFLIPK